jgi:post-segregation antitoxin (ccd killing protein)
MGAKKQTLLYIDSDITQKAKELGLNISKVSENALREVIRRLEGIDPEIG